MHVLQFLDYCTKGGRLDSYWNMCCSGFVCVCREGYFKQLGNSSGVCRLKSLLEPGAVNLRAGALGLHPRRSQSVARYVVSSTVETFLSCAEGKNRDVVWAAMKWRRGNSDDVLCLWKKITIASKLPPGMKRRQTREWFTSRWKMHEVSLPGLWHSSGVQCMGFPLTCEEITFNWLFIPSQRKTKSTHTSSFWCAARWKHFCFNKKCWFNPLCPTSLSLNTGLNKMLLGPVSPWRLQKALEGFSFLRSLARLALRSYGYCSSRGLVGFPAAGPSECVRSALETPARSVLK